MQVEIGFRDVDKEIVLKEEVEDVDALEAYLNGVMEWRRREIYLAAQADVEVEMPLEIDRPEPKMPSHTIHPGEPWGMIDVGEAVGKRGDVVQVEIIGATSAKITGFHMAVNYESDALEIQEVVFGPFLYAATTKATRLEHKQIMKRGHPRVGNVGGGVANIALSFVGIHPQEKLRENQVRFADAIVIPPNTILATMKILILPKARTTTYKLLNWSRKLGMPPIRTLYATEDAKGIAPELYDGSVTVID